MLNPLLTGEQAEGRRRLLGAGDEGEPAVVAEGEAVWVGVVRQVVVVVSDDDAGGRWRRRRGLLELALHGLVELAAAVRGGLLAVLARHDDVPVVLDGVVGAAREEARDHGPLVAVEPVRRHQPLLLLVAEGPLADARVQLVEPAQAAALPCTARAQQHIIFFHIYLIKRAFQLVVAGTGRTCGPIESERTGSAVELLRDEVPVLGPVERDQLPELGVLGGAPVPAPREPGLPAAAAVLLVVAGIGAAASRGGAGVHGGRAGREHEAAAALGRRGGRLLVGRRGPYAQQPRRGRRRARHLCDARR
jgi:hypothetical protein